MKRHSQILPLLFLFFSQLAFAGQMKSIATTAEEAIYNYFYSSGRKVEKIKIENFSRIDIAVQKYLVEAEVRAQSARYQHMMNYRCGVFVQKTSLGWEELHTTCESLSIY